MRAPFRVERCAAGETLRVEGEVEGESARELGELLAREAPEGPGELALDLEGLELLGGVAVAELVNALRSLLARGLRLSLLGAPQMLAHTLYKAGLLEGEKLTLLHPRRGEPFE